MFVTEAPRPVLDVEFKGCPVCGSACSVDVRGVAKLTGDSPIRDLRAALVNVGRNSPPVRLGKAGLNRSNGGLLVNFAIPRA